jgi:enoyl-ACP reductase-like protein
VNSIHPGVIQTDMGEQTFVSRAQRSGTNDTTAARQTVVGTVPSGRLGVPLDIAKGIVFLASDDSSYMDGAGLVVDGGMTATRSPAGAGRVTTAAGESAEMDGKPDSRLIIGRPRHPVNAVRGNKHMVAGTQVALSVSVDPQAC